MTRYPYLLYYRIGQEGIVIIAVRHYRQRRPW